MLNLADSYL